MWYSCTQEHSEKLKKVNTDNSNGRIRPRDLQGVMPVTLPSRLHSQDSILPFSQQIYLYWTRQIRCFINLLVQTRRLLLLIKQRASDSSVAVGTVQSLFQIQVGLD